MLLLIPLPSGLLLLPRGIVWLLTRLRSLLVLLTPGLLLVLSRGIVLPLILFSAWLLRRVVSRLFALLLWLALLVLLPSGLLVFLLGLLILPLFFGLRFVFLILT